VNKILIFIPTFEEVDNVARLCEQVLALPLPLDIHFIDDASPDGTGWELDRLAALHPRVTVSHRSKNLGIGSAHQEGIAYAYRQGYELLVTMDADFTHDPRNIPDLLDAREDGAVVLGSRYFASDSLPGWTRARTLMTRLGHCLTRGLLHVEHDATNAFRLYDLRTLPAGLFGLVRSDGYSFFFESLFVFVCNGIRIREIPIILPKRTAGRSKMSWAEAWRSVKFLFKLYAERKLNSGRFLLGPSGYNDK
jgi:dolichol-phosphate mannosyltransferase